MRIIKIVLRDFLGLKFKVFKNIRHIKSAVSWVKEAQLVTGTGGVSAWYRFDKGWGEPFIETTGYLITTMLETFSLLNIKSCRQMAYSMADFVVKMQLPSGGFRTYITNDNPTIFNTAQDLSGLCDIYKYSKLKRYYSSAKLAADFLIKNQNKDGSWVKYSYDGRSHSYDSKVGHALLKFYQISKKTKYKKAAVLCLHKVLKYQDNNGWFKNAELPGFVNPPTHTIAYVIEGLLDSGILLKNKNFIKAASRAADKLMQYFENNKFMPATFNNIWESYDKYSCLTGNAQISVVWSKLYKITNNKKYLINTIEINNYLKSLQDCSSKSKNILGGIKGSHPVYGDLFKNKGYCRFAFINWGAKYFIDALLMEESITKAKEVLYV